MTLTSIIPSFLLFLSGYKYLLLFVSTIFEGPVLMLASGFLVLTGFLDPLPAFMAMVAGDLVGDLVWYHIGRFFAEPFIRKYGKFFKIEPEIFERAKNLFKDHHVKILLISKVAIGLGLALATLMAAGASRVPLKKFLFLNFIGELFLVGMLMSIGYLLGQTYTIIPNTLKTYSLFIGILVFTTSAYFVTKKIKKSILIDQIK